MIQDSTSPPDARENDLGLPPDEAKDRVKAATLAVFRHYAGPPRSRLAPEKGPEGRYAFDCPACGSARKLTVIIFQDGRPPGYGRGGCSSPSCVIPKNGDALEFVRAFLTRGKGSPPTFDEVLAAALHAARAHHAPAGEAAAEEDTGAASEPSGSLVSGSLSLPPDPLEDGGTDAAEPSSANPTPEGSSPALFDLPEGSLAASSPDRAAVANAGRSAIRKSPGALAEVQPTLLAEPDAGKADLGARAAVYEALLRLCPPDERLLEDLKALGISEDLARRESFGAFYPARASEVLASLQLSVGAARLLAAPGFAAPAGRGPVAFELEGAGDDALYALVPYRDVRARVIALEAISLSGTRGFGSHRLLGCPPDGRDPHLGGTHHVWYAGDPRRLQAVTDDLLEGLRAASAGVRCAATRGPESFDPGAGNDTAPSLRDLTLGGARVLYAPSPSARAREAAPRAAWTLISRLGGVALVLAASFEEGTGLGSYLLGHAPEDRTRAFALLASGPHAVPLPPEQAAPREASAGATSGAEISEPRQPPPSAFEVEARKAPSQPRKRKGPAPADLLAGAGSALIVFLAALAPILALAGPAGDVLRWTASALETASPTGGAGSSFPLAEPSRWIPYLLGRALGSYAYPAAAALRELSPGGDLAAVCLAAIVLGAAGAGLTVTLFRQRHHRKRIKMMEGRLKEW